MCEEAKTLSEKQVAYLLLLVDEDDSFGDVVSEMTMDSAFNDERLELHALGLYDPGAGRPTEKAKVYVRALQQVPLPVEKWVMPDE